MPANDEMSLDERRKYLKRMWPRYATADREQRTQLLTEMQLVTGLHRKSLLRLLNAPSLERHKRSTPRARTYGPQTEAVVLTVWRCLDYICPERLTPALLPTARHLAGFGELQLDAQIEQHLRSISHATVGRMLARHRVAKLRLPQRGPQQVNSLRRDVPMERIPWDTAEPGHFEVDLVQHSGPNSSGDYLYTIQMVDVATGWSERVVVLGRSARAMEGGFRHIQQRLPFAIRELHPDNGSEFFNAHMIRYFGTALVGVRLSRSRPYHKNDNRFVEQKNDSLVRRYLGYGRFDTREQQRFIAALYEQMWVYYNLFQPVLHLASKEVVAGKLKRRWDEARSPYQRLLESGVMAQGACARLAELYQQTNPRALRQEIYQRLDLLWKNAAAVG